MSTRESDREPESVEVQTAIAEHIAEHAQTHEPSNAENEPTIVVSVEVPVSVAVALKHRTGGALDIAETLSLIAQMYKDAPLARGSRVLSVDEYGLICAALGQSPQTNAELIAAIEAMVTFSLAGVKMKWNAEEIMILGSRNATSLPVKEWAELVFAQMKEAWINGRI